MLGIGAANAGSGAFDPTPKRLMAICKLTADRNSPRIGSFFSFGKQAEPAIGAPSGAYGAHGCHRWRECLFRQACSLCHGANNFRSAVGIVLPVPASSPRDAMASGHEPRERAAPSLGLPWGPHERPPDAPERFSLRGHYNVGSTTFWSVLPERRIAKLSLPPSLNRSLHYTSKAGIGRLLCRTSTDPCINLLWLEHGRGKGRACRVIDLVGP
jgi:hypothetical protein